MEGVTFEHAIKPHIGLLGASRHLCTERKSSAMPTVPPLPPKSVWTWRRRSVLRGSWGPFRCVSCLTPTSARTLQCTSFRGQGSPRRRANQEGLITRPTARMGANSSKKILVSNLAATVTDVDVASFLHQQWWQL
jgi:hypothetical protein